jgi:hypothetical protein
MPLFKHSTAEPVQPAAAPARSSTSSTGGSRHGIFSSRRTSSPETSTTTSPAPSSNRNFGFLHRNGEDPSISHARERVARAEEAERQADRALIQARNAVKEAREHVKRLEAEAAEEYVWCSLVGVEQNANLFAELDLQRSNKARPPTSLSELNLLDATGSKLALQHSFPCLELLSLQIV